MRNIEVCRKCSNFLEKDQDVDCLTGDLSFGTNGWIIRIYNYLTNNHIKNYVVRYVPDTCPYKLEQMVLVQK